MSKRNSRSEQKKPIKRKKKFSEEDEDECFFL